MNFIQAMILVLLCYIIGEVVSYYTKAWIPSVFVTAICFIAGYWTFFPSDIVTTSGMLPWGSSIGIYLLLVHMGSTISIRQLLDQWKTIVVCLAGLAGMCLFAWLICVNLIGQDLVIAGLPPLTGGIVAATTMQTAFTEAGNELAALFAISMYCVQGFAGYPLTAVMLKLEGKRLLTGYRSGNIETGDKVGAIDEVSGNMVQEKKESKKLIPPMPAGINTTAMILLKLCLCGYVAYTLGTIVWPIINMKISGAVWALLVGIVATQIGFVDENALTKAQSVGLVMIALMCYVFDGLKTATPEVLSAAIGPMIILIVVGVAGMALFCFIVGKILKLTFPMAFATALTALYGFPPNAIITENTIDSMAENPEEKAYLMGHMFPRMIVGGFTTVTITSVVIAGIFSGFVG